jgi:hypothetical protein
MNKSALRVNHDYDWDIFDTKAYSSQYLSGVLWEDRSLARMTIGALLELGVSLGSLQTGIDACNGGIIRGPSIIAPFIRGNGTLYWSDYGKPQVEQAKRVITAGKKGDLGEWASHQTHMGLCYHNWSGASLRACQLGVSVRQSIFELPENAYDIGITCFGPESLTEDRKEWERAVTTFLRSIKPGQPAIMLYMVGSTGYSSPGSSFPAIPISQEDVLSIATNELERTQAFTVASVSQAVRPEGEPHSQEGMGGIVGLRRA